MSIPSEQYIQNVKKQLICKRATKNGLISELRGELELSLKDSAPEERTYEEICKRFGSPEKLAKELMDTVDETEIIQTRNRKKLLLGLIFAILIIALVFTYYRYRQSLLLDPDKVIIRTYETIPVPVDEGELYDE